MSGETVLVVDDAPANLKLTRLVLDAAGYEVRTAKDAEEALALLKDFRPRAVLTDLRLPGMDGLELTKRLRTDPATQHAVILAVTACALQSDEQKATEAGFDGYIVKPYDTRKLPSIVREHLSKITRPVPAPDAGAAALPAAELRRRFLAEGAAQSRSLTESLANDFDLESARVIFKRWAGLGATLGEHQISRLAQQAGILLDGPDPRTSPELRHTLDQLFHLFNRRPPRRRRTAPLSGEIVKQLAGKRMGLIGFEEDEVRRLSGAFAHVHATAQPLNSEEALPAAAAPGSVDLVIVNLRHGTSPPEWMRRRDLVGVGHPILAVGSRDLLLEHGVSLNGAGHDFLLWPWEPEEAVMRACLALSRAAARQPVKNTAPGRPNVVMADDDPTTVALVKATLESYGVDCRVAADGGQVLELIAASPASAVILDVNIANLDGFEVLAALRRDEGMSDVPVVFLTSRQQETDILRAFGLGADDYIVKPFSPMELAARIKRLIRKSA